MKLLRMTLRLALSALERNRMRSSLTVLGIVIGVAAFIAMVAIGRGATASVKAQIESLGSNVLMILPGASTSSGARSGWGGVSTLTKQDAEAIERECGSVVGVTYFVRRVVQVVNGNRNWSTVVQGVNPEFPKVHNWALSRGIFYDDRDERVAAKVAVLGQTVVDNLFGIGQDPVGAIIRIRGVPVRVIGVLVRKGQSMWGRDQDDLVVIPFSTAERRILGTSILGLAEIVFAQVRTQAEIEEASQQIQELLRQRHRIQEGEEEDFTVRDLSEFSSALSQATRTMTWVLGSVAALSLLVGGIGIMNILLVSVTERTREIGIRLAVGAKARHILAQFLVESVVLSAAGGMVGILLGVGAAQLLARLAHWPVLISPLTIAGGLLFSAAVGLIFGVYPARRAAHLDPIEALRYE